ncbi:hypothetical protein [Streptomyces sp. NPDC047097]|uniref:hypothetical protein n=1 Tax=Streptomyces sp. NPDC047097 TaxID=3155260 RepID=UPI0033FD0019
MPSPAAPAHTRTRPWQWLATLAATASVVAGAALLDTGAGTATATPPARTPAPAAAPAPGAASVPYPLDCAGAPTTVVRRASGDLDGDRRPETVAEVRCAAGSGTPPSGLYVLAGDGKDGARVVATLVDPAERLSLGALGADGGAVTAVLLGYSSADVPRCCPDTRETVTWRWRNGAFLRTGEDTGTASGAGTPGPI